MDCQKCAFLLCDCDCDHCYTELFSMNDWLQEKQESKTSLEYFAWVENKMDLLDEKQLDNMFFSKQMETNPELASLVPLTDYRKGV